jgi:alkylhydroperoxidase/carboxymuconolactone decarboxylase family protein YurZ
MTTQETARETGQDAGSWRDHYLDTLGNIPSAIAQMADLDETLIEAYTTIRRRTYGEEEGRLPLKYRELLFVVMDIEVGNQGGAENHLRAGIAAGLTRRELADALLELFIVRGVSAWGMVGHRLWETSASWFPEAT